MAVYCMHVCLVAQEPPSCTSSEHLLQLGGWIAAEQKETSRHEGLTHMLCARPGRQQLSVEGLLEVMVPEVTVGRGLHGQRNLAPGALGRVLQDCGLLGRHGRHWVA